MRWRLAWFVLLAGCPAPGAGMSSSGPLDPDAFATAAAEANCALLFDCCTVSEIQGVFTGPGVSTEAECRAQYEAMFRSEASSLQPRIDAGLALWDADAAGTCVASVTAAQCPALLTGVLADGFITEIERDPYSDCARRARGTGVDGSSCGAAIDCASGYCAGELGMQSCAEPPGLGEPCTDRCAEGLGCDVRAAAPTCVVRRPDGSACTSPGFGDVCESLNCAADATCQPFPPVMRCTGTR